MQEPARTTASTTMTTEVRSVVARPARRRSMQGALVFVYVHAMSWSGAAENDQTRLARAGAVNGVRAAVSQAQQVVV
jgi:hypothetical protein